jgi:hypothetical protein
MNQDFKEVVDVVVESAKAYHAAKADGKIDLMDLMLIFPILMKLPAAVKGSPEAFKNLGADDIKAAAVEILEAAGEFDGKVKIYVEEGFTMVGLGVEMFASFKRLQAA